MIRVLKGTLLALFAAGFVAAAALGADRKPDEILKELDAVKLPQFDNSKAGDRAEITKFLLERQKVADKRGELIRELYRVDPTHPRLVELFPERWMNAQAVGEKGDVLAKEIDEVLAKTKSAPLKVEASFAKVRMTYFKAVVNAKAGTPPDFSNVMPAIEQFLKIAPRTTPAPASAHARRQHRERRDAARRDHRPHPQGVPQERGRAPASLPGSDAHAR